MSDDYDNDDDSEALANSRLAFHLSLSTPSAVCL